MQVDWKLIRQRIVSSFDLESSKFPCICVFSIFLRVIFITSIFVTYSFNNFTVLNKTRLTNFTFFSSFLSLVSVIQLCISIQMLLFGATPACLEQLYLSLINPPSCLSPSAIISLSASSCLSHSICWSVLISIPLTRVTTAVFPTLLLSPNTCLLLFSLRFSSPPFFFSALSFSSLL